MKMCPKPTYNMASVIGIVVSIFIITPSQQLTSPISQTGALKGDRTGLWPGYPSF